MPAITTTAATNARKAVLERVLTEKCGTQVELTVRGAREFTLSAEGDAVAKLENLRGFLAASGVVRGWECAFHADCDFTTAFFSIA